MDPHKLKASAKSTFSPLVILRGLELTIIGVVRAVQNPKFWSPSTFKQAIIAIVLSITLGIILQAPINVVRFFLFGVRQVVDIQSTFLDVKILNTLSFIEKKVLQLPIILMSALQYLTPALDNLFMMSLQWVDITYREKHKHDDPATLRPMYYDNLRKYPTRAPPSEKGKGQKSKWEKFLKVMNSYIKRYSKRIAMGLGVYIISQEPHIGKYALGGVTAYNMWKTIGLYPAGVILVASQFVPRTWTMVFFQGLLQSRTLMRELLEPYFKRVRFTPKQKKIWFRDRQGLLFGFGFGFYLFLQIPYFGVLIYGLAEASTALLITKLTSPPPPPENSAGFAESQLHWQYKDTFSFPKYIPQWINRGEKYPGAKFQKLKLKQ